MATNIKASVAAYRNEYGPEGTPESFPVGQQIGLAASALDSRLEKYFPKIKYKGFRSHLLKLARLQVSAHLLGRTNLVSYKELWRCELQALQDWAETADEKNIKAVLRATGWYQTPSEENIQLLIASVPTKTQEKVKEYFNVS